MITKYNKAQITTHVRQGLCIKCGQPATHFKSCECLKSYKNTGLCQRCQEQLKGENNE